MIWFAVHVVMQVEFKEPPQSKFPVWENIYIVNALNEGAALKKGEQIGLSHEGDSHGSFTWEGKPSKWIFVGVRKMVTLNNSNTPSNDPGDGCEVTYTTLEFSSKAELKQFINAEPVTAKILD